MSRLFGPGSGSEYVSVKDGEIGIGADAPGDFPANEWPGGSESNVILNFVAGDEITNEYAIDMGDYVGGRLVTGGGQLWFVVPVSNEAPVDVRGDWADNVPQGEGLRPPRWDHGHELKIGVDGSIVWDAGEERYKAVLK